MKTIMPDYQTGLLNVMSSVMKRFGCATPYPTHPVLDEYLAKGDTNVFVILIDAMGSRIIESRMPEDSFLRKHMVTEMTSVYPPTTAAATTIFSTGLAPISSGWLGWQEYFEDVDDYRVLFTNKGYYSDIRYDDDTIRKHLYPYDAASKKVRDAGYGYQIINPRFDPNGVKSLEEMKDRILSYANTLSNTYTYVYWDELDSLMHDYGVEDQHIDDHLKEIDRVFEELSEELPPNNLLVIVADHGQITCESVDVTQYPDLCDTFVRKPALEQRTVVFYIQEDRKEEFEKLFNQYYGKNFKLYSSKDFIQEYLGPFEKHPYVDKALGDYVAVAIGDQAMFFGKVDMKGQHAGLTVDEMMVPLIIFRKE